MRYTLYLILACLIAFPLSVFAGVPPVQTEFHLVQTDDDDEEAYAYYDLRNRRTYIQLTANNSEQPDLGNVNICVHIQIFQQDKGCSELNFEDELTINDTVVYDMDNLVRNDGTEVAINLDDDSYGYVAFSAYECGNRANEEFYQVLLGNVRIIDDAGYEYRMNLFTDDDSKELTEFDNPTALANVIIPFNTVDGARFADVVGFVLDDDRNIAGIDGDDDDDFQDVVYNEDDGITFSVFQIDENEERLSCDQVTFACGAGKVMNYGINEDYPNSRGGPLLCEGAGLVPGQTHGYISLENATEVSPLDLQDPPEVDSLEFICMVGLNNGDGTGSMDECQIECIDGPENCEED